MTVCHYGTFSSIEGCQQLTVNWFIVENVLDWVCMSVLRFIYMQTHCLRYKVGVLNEVMCGNVICVISCQL